MSGENPVGETWVEALPDGAVSVSAVDGNLVLRASGELQKTFERLLSMKKEGRIGREDLRRYEAICELDMVLSRLNRELRVAAVP